MKRCARMRLGSTPLEPTDRGWPVRASRAAVLATALLGWVASPVHAAAGRTPVTYDVSATGEAIVSIPIRVPPGTRGLTPALALTYMHRSGGSLAGAGWSIAGLSAIVRCGGTWAQDGATRQVRNDWQDGYCLDGNRLRLVAGTHGQAGSEYRTELETFARVRAYGQAGNGPAYFVVERKDGLVHEFGATVDSRIESLGQSTVRVWALNRIRDRSGNAIEFAYDEDATYGSHRIARVQYTANALQGVVPQYEVWFSYVTKPANEIDSTYQAGSAIREVMRLGRVDVRHAGVTQRYYQLAYETSPSSTIRSRLASVQECAGSNCLPPTAFTYQNGIPGLGAESSTGASVPSPAQALPLDVNGDGRDDLVYPSSATPGAGTWMVMLANDAGYAAPFSTGITNANHAGAIPIDYNADGRDDLLVPHSGGTWWVMLGQAGGLLAPSDTGAPATATGTGANARAIDVNGDGLDDLVWADLVGYSGGDAIRYRLRERGGNFSASIETLVGPLPAGQQVTPGVFSVWAQKMPRRAPDFDGDGRPDLAFRHSLREVEPGAPTVYAYSITIVCQGGSTFANWTSEAASEPYFGDFNGDGRSDVFYYDATGRWRYRFSRGTDLGPELDAGFVSGYGVGSVVLDWDGDGYDDVLLPRTSSGTWHLMRSTGDALAAAINTGLSSSGASFATVTDVDGDGLHDLAYASGGAWKLRKHAGVTPDLLLSATDGYGNRTTFSYSPLTRAEYTRYTDATYPSQDYAGPLSVVTSLAQDDGIGGTYTTGFAYFGARTDLQGRGFEGFAARRHIDSRDGLRRWSYYNRGFPLTGTPSRVEVMQATGVPIARTDSSWSHYQYGSGTSARYLPILSGTTASTYAVGGTWNGALIATTGVATTVDRDTGTITHRVRTTTEAPTANGIHGGATWQEDSQVSELFTYVTADAWCIGRPSVTELVLSHSGGAGQVQQRRVDTVWDGATCRPTQHVAAPGHPDWQVTSTLAYDAFGNPTTETITAAGLPARTSRITWAPNGQRPVEFYNPLSQRSVVIWDAATGLPLRALDPNTLEATWTYDAFGRVTREKYPDRTSTTWRYEDCSVSGCSGANHELNVAVEMRDTADSVIRDQRFELDRFDRPIATNWRLLTGAYGRADVEYDALGRVRRESAPCIVGNCIQYWTTFGYDAVGRMVQASRPRSADDPTLVSTGYEYQGLTVRVTDALGKQSTRTANAAGQLAQSGDHAGYALGYEYDAFGNLAEVTDSLGNTLQSDVYDDRGLRTSSYDTDRGSWAFRYDALGQLLQLTDANGKSTTWTYDSLGRPLTETIPEGAGSITSRWTWGTSSSGRNIGRLTQAQISGPGLTTYSEGYTYDGFGRLTQTRHTEGSSTYFVDRSYSGATGLLDVLTYPASTSGFRFKVRYQYQFGYPKLVQDASGSGGTYWQAITTDARGNVVDELLGNGVRSTRDIDPVSGLLGAVRSGVGGGAALQNLDYQWDAAGNLTRRLDANQGLAESFTYDDLHRLTRADTGSTALDVTYDSLGNVASKSGVGTFAYLSSRLHAVTRVTPQSGAARNYSYDANGNMTSRAGTEVTWFANDLPKAIRATPGVSTNSSEFQYTPDGDRWRHRYDSGGTVQTHVSIGGLLDKVVQVNSTDYRHAVYVNGRVVALHSRSSSGTNTTRYLLRDHLGSVDVVTGSNGGAVLRESFDAHGARRAANWSGVPSGSELATIAGITREGFTGHEHLDSTGLVHMNGRAYDPQLGRFISADPFVDGAASTQGWNRYSYVHNRPLRFVDPTGFSANDAGELNKVVFIDQGRQQVDLSATQTAVIKSIVVALTCAAGACPLGAVFAATWTSNSADGQRPTQSWFTMPGSSGLAGVEPEVRIRGLPPRTPPAVARRTVADPSLSADFAAASAGPSALLVFLDVVSATNIPAASELAGLTSAVIYAIDADWVGAGLAVAGIFPALGTSADIGRLGRLTRSRVSAAANAGSIGPNIASSTNAMKQSGSAVAHADEAFHYTFSKYLASIRANGLRQGTYATRSGSLSPLQAQIELALPPNRGLPDALVRVDIAGLRRAGYEIPEMSRVSSRFGLPGGGYEMHFPYPIPPQFIAVVP